MHQMVFPDETGFVRGLYEMQGLPGPLQDQFERLFLSPVDSKAAEALNMMERGEMNWTADLRSGWTRFILTLLLRMPEDVADMKALAQWHFFHDEDVEKRYRSLRRESDPDTWAMWVEKRDPHLVGNAAFRIAQKLMDHEKIGTDINHFSWSLVKTDHCRFELLTSDRPVTMSSNLSLPDAFILLPIGPRRLFLACREPFSVDSKRVEKLATLSNKHVVDGAVSYVYATTSAARRYVEKNMGSQPVERIVARLRRNRENKPP